jgi:hypothetical protein
MTEATSPILRQWLCISARPEVLQATIDAYALHLPHVTELILVCPRALQPAFLALRTGALRVRLYHDEDLLPNIALHDDHQARNSSLRHALLQQAVLDEWVLMGDDDARPLQKVPPSFFFQQGQCVAYSFWENLSKWCGHVSAPSSYDEGQWRTGAYLQNLGASVHSFSVHFPQVLNTHWARSIYRTHAAALAQGMDEWSLYFNIAIGQYPQAFRLRSLRALAWPARPSDWLVPNVAVCPYFENVSPELYTCHGVFFGLDDVTRTLHQAQLKFARYQRHCEQAWRLQAAQKPLEAPPSSFPWSLHGAAGTLHHLLVYAREDGCLTWQNALKADRHSHVVRAGRCYSLPVRLPWWPCTGRATWQFESDVFTLTYTVTASWPTVRYGVLYWGGLAYTLRALPFLIGEMIYRVAGIRRSKSMNKGSCASPRKHADSISPLRKTK